MTTVTRGIVDRLRPYRVTGNPDPIRKPVRLALDELIEARFPTGAIDQSHPLRWSVFSGPGGNTPKDTA